MPKIRIHLPKPAKTFLESPEGRWCLQTVRIFHHWMNDHGLVLGDLTAAHVDCFFEHEKQKKLSPSTRFERSCRVHKYLYRLFVDGHLRFVVEPPLLRHMRITLPEIAARFLEISGKQQYAPSVRNFHDWMHRKHIELDELTPAHITTFLQRPISKDIGKHARHERLKKIVPYLSWLNEQGLVKFRIDCEPRKAFPSPPSVHEFVNTLRPVLKSSTCKGYIHDLGDFHAWLAASQIDLRSFDRSHAEKWLKSLADRGLAACTRNGRIFHMRSYLRRLFDLNAIDAYPDDLLQVTDLPKIPLYLPRPFPPDADRILQRRFIEQDTTFGRALFLMRRSGVRMGELVRLEPDCMHRDLCGNIFLKVPLGKLDNERLVPLDDQAQDVLQTLRKQCPKGAEFLILPKLSREKLKSHLSQTLRQAAAGLDIPGAVVSHRLRHTYATELLNAGLSLVTIMKLLGHKSFRMTMRYAAIAQRTVVDDYRAAMDRIIRKYETQGATSQSAVDFDPKRQIVDLISSLRKVADAKPEAKKQIDSVIKRIYKASDDIAALLYSLQIA